jgi:tetratricopeptide (TPR) repeat protein
VPPRQNERALALQEEIGRKLRAMELDAQSKEQMAAGDTRQALETLKAALELDPNNADAQVCAWWWLRSVRHTHVCGSVRVGSGDAPCAMSESWLHPSLKFACSSLPGG